MGTEGTRARSHAHAKRHGRYTVHVVVVLLATLAVTFAARYPDSSNGNPRADVPSFALSGVTGLQHLSSNNDSFFRPRGTIETRQSITAFSLRSDVASVRAAGAVLPTSSFSAGVSAATANSGEQDAGIKPLADIVDPRQPFVLYEAMPGDSVSLVAQRFGIEMGTLLDNNPTVQDRNLLQRGQQLIVPRKDGILYKVGHGDSISSIVAQFDNITASTVLDYKPNALGDGSSLETGRYVLLPGATRKLQLPPPPAIDPAPRPGGGSAAPPPSSGGRFSHPLNRWLRVSDPFGVGRGGGRIHEGIDLDLYGMWSSPVFSACNGTVSRTEYLTYSYGYYVVVDCGDGWTTLYAHLSAIHVSPGQRVNQGAQLGLSGSTGFSTGEHLHFEIRLNGAPLNPAYYLDF
jgi:murein DD-endopeptidase MepM/ murein hydrolase activator NlpD